MNVIVKFVYNPKKKDQIVAFLDKKICLLHPDSKDLVKVNEHWECYMWGKHEKYLVLKPFKKIDEKSLNEELKRVDNFNKELEKLESILKSKSEFFEKIVFSAENKPYLKAKVAYDKVKAKFSDYIVRKLELRNGDRVIVARPIMTPEDRLEWRNNP